MANYAEIKDEIAAAIYPNENQEIDAVALRDTLDAMVDALGNGYLFKGVATLIPPATDPGTPDTNVFYLAGSPGTYENFGGLTVNAGEIAIFAWDGTWTKYSTGALTAAAIADDLTTNDASRVLSAKQGVAIKALLNSGYLFAGKANASTNPGTPSTKVFYIADASGMYMYFDNITLYSGEVAILRYDGSWHKVTLDIGTKSYLLGRIGEQNTEIAAQNARIADFIADVQAQVDSYPMISISGDVTNAPDEEDITTDANDLLKFKNRSPLFGKGYIILRMGQTFASQLSQQNTIYEIRYEFDLNGADVVVPEGCELRFVGGKLTHGRLLLSPFCCITGTSKDEYCLEGVYVKLNKRCTLRRLAMLFTNPTADLITFSLSDVEYDAYYSDTHIQLSDMLIHAAVDEDDETGDYVVPLVNAINFSADVETTNKNLAGCFNIAFSGIDFKGRFSSAFRFYTQYANSWFTQLSFVDCFIIGARCGWDFNPTAGGSVDGVAITNCGYQHFEDTTYAIAGSKLIDLKVTGTRFWDFPNGVSVCAFDSKCVGINFDKMALSGTTKPYDMTIRAGDNVTANSQIRIGAALYDTGDISKYLSADTQITLADLFTLPDGLYLLPTTDADKYLTNWGIRLGDNYKEPAYLSISKNYGNLVAVVYTSKRPVSGSYNSGAIQVIATNRHDATAVKTMWDIHIPAAQITKAMLDRIVPFSGESHLVGGTYLIPVWWDSTNSKWRGADGYILDRRTGGLSNRPSGLGTSDKGYPYYDTSLVAMIYWAGSYWADANGVNLTGVTALRGTTSTRDGMTLSADNKGLLYYNTNNNRYELWNGTAWVNVDGSALS